MLSLSPTPGPWVRSRHYRMLLCLLHSVALYLSNLLCAAVLVSPALSPSLITAVEPTPISGGSRDWLPISSSQAHLLVPSALHCLCLFSKPKSLDTSDRKSQKQGHSGLWCRSKCYQKHLNLPHYFKRPTQAPKGWVTFSPVGKWSHFSSLLEDTWVSLSHDNTES